MRRLRALEFLVRSSILDRYYYIIKLLICAFMALGDIKKISIIRPIYIY
jgi:hypothetical protein